MSRLSTTAKHVIDESNMTNLCFSNRLKDINTVSNYKTTTLPSLTHNRRYIKQSIDLTTMQQLQTELNQQEQNIRYLQTSLINAFNYKNKLQAKIETLIYQSNTIKE